MSRFQASLELMKASWQVLRSERQLCWYPVVSTLCAIAIGAIFIVPIALAFAGTDSRERTIPLWAYAVLALMYVALAFVQSFFNAALISAANEHFNGGRATFAGGLAIASRHLGTIAGWAVIAATVGIVLRALQERFGLLGRLVVGALGVGWNLLTYFVVPVLVFEGVGPVQAIKRSGSLFKARWGEAVVGSTGIGLAGVLVVVPAVILFGVGIVLIGVSVAVGAAVIAVSVAAIVAACIALSAMQQIYNTALYRYATDAPTSGHFSTQLLAQTFRSKGAR